MAQTSVRRAASFIYLLLSVFGSASTSLAGSHWGQTPCIDPTFGIAQKPFSPKRVYELPRWIWGNPRAGKKALIFGRDFEVTHLPKKALLYAVIKGPIHLWINGKAVSPGSMAKHGPLQTCMANITSYLRLGVNRIFFSAGGRNHSEGVNLSIINRDHGWHTVVRTDKYWYWSAMSVGDQSPWRHAASGHWQRAIALPPPSHVHLNLWPAHWHYLYHLHFQPERLKVIRGAQAFTGLQTVPLRLTAENAGALRPGYTGDSHLAPARPIHLVIRPSHLHVHLVRGTNVIGWSILNMPARSSAPGIILDFGQEVAGRIIFRGSGGDVIVGTGESRGEALKMPWGGVHLLHLRAHHTEATPYSAFRYATVYFAGGHRISLHQLSLDFKYYPVKYRGSFACSDPLLTKIWYTGAYTAHLCMQQQIWDAPKRDRSLWIGDIQISGQTINNVFLTHYLMEKSMTMVRLEAQGVRRPNALPLTYVNSLPGYSNSWLCALSDYYLHTGDLAYLKSQHQLILSMLRYMRKGFNKQHLFTNKWKARWNFVDWAPYLVAAPDTPQANIATDLYTCQGIRRAVRLLDIIGDKANAAKYAAWGRKIMLAARRKLALPTGTYTNIRQVNSMAVLSHVATARQRRAIFKRILGPHCASWKQIATPYYNNFVIFALSDLGQYRQALRFIRLYWGGMIRRGATTFWEKYYPSCPKIHPHRYLNNNGGGPSGGLGWNYLISLCHGWSSGVTNWLTVCVLGARPIQGGFQTVLISPHLMGLQWAGGAIPTPHGPIAIQLVAHNNLRDMRLVLPKGVNGMLDVACTKVLVNGQPAAVASTAGRIFHTHVRLTGGRSYRVVWTR